MNWKENLRPSYLDLNGEEIFDDIVNVFRENAPLYAMLKKKEGLALFKRGCIDVNDYLNSVHLRTATITEMIDYPHDLVLVDPLF